LQLQENIQNLIEVLPESLGEHLIIDFYQCDLFGFCESLSELSIITDLIIDNLKNNRIEVLGHHNHFFLRDAVSLTLNLSESHLNFHTWPEKKYVSFDFFCCTKVLGIRKIMQDVANFCDSSFFHSKKKSEKFISRGLDF
jgi:S-adenosylmethionine/arginine decarboxylase-like enzyme